MNSEITQKEVNCLALTFFFEYLRGHNIDPKIVLEGFGLPLEYFENRTNWISYATFLEIEKRVGDLFPDQPDVFFDIGRTFASTKSMGFARVIVRAVLSPYAVYSRVPRLVKKFLFPFVDITFEKTARNHLLGTYKFTPGYAPSEAYLATVRGILTGVPAILGASEAEVLMKRVSELEATYDIAFGEKWVGPWQFIKRFFGRLFGTLKAQLQNARDALKDLEETNKLLQDKVDALTIAEAGLREFSQTLELRVKERTVELEDARGKLEDTVDRLKRSDQSRSDFFTNVSHELKTPLALILAPVDDLEAQMKKAEMHNGLNSVHLIRDNAKLLLRHINEILDFAKIDSGKIQLQREDVDLNQFLADVVVSLQPLALKKRLNFTYEKPAEDIHLPMDPKLIRRVFVNLLSNAIKYVEEEDDVTIRVSYNDDEVQIAVADTGPGIPPEYHATIFERFSRVPDSRGRTIEGTGVGLAMVREIVQLHHGDIKVTSQLGMGATFTVTLPRKVPAEELATSTQRQQTTQEYSSKSLSDIPLALPTSETTADLQTMQSATPQEKRPVVTEQSYEHGTLLLVEDNPSMRDFVQRLCSERYNVIAAPDGQQGLNIAAKELPDLILSDVMMPVMNGYEMCRRLRANPVTRNIPVVLISARHGTEAAVEALEAGANDFIVKPFSAHELLARLDTQLKVRRLTLALIRAEKQSSLSTLAAGIGHEVLNPLNAVINGSAALRLTIQRIAQTTSSKEIAAFDALINSIENAGRRIQKVVDAILAVTRQSPNGLQMAESRLSDRIDAVLAVLNYRIGKINVHREVLWNEPILCYPDLLHQVILNLVVNAIDATSASGGQNIWITTDCVDGMARLHVRDDGTGVPRHLRNRIFDAFFTTKAPGAGTGLGLAICKEIADLHGGTIDLNPQQEAGAEFVFSIPTSQPEPNKEITIAPNLQAVLPPP
jgi:signal transduction histidine kinase